ncbi:hypothetical protein [Gallionella capsiferriformans]|jgi:hypothetical protein|uniref:Uncharacterized protein n=1 Tax=Gallionella capsiferriformans (strain ES-2) TaxID=395494 RepID=D9SH74_GALCS|nr:hypothetical protein [Gallionella capsiferriformans]ADL55871.1 hypothetical protein Galf_1861 [Gallionella capsiferriformans ES-2]
MPPFALIEQRGSGLGNAYAGGAASAEDADDFFSNAPRTQNAAVNMDLAGKGYLLCRYNSSVDILSVQYAHSF